MAVINFNKAQFLISAASLTQLPTDEGYEVAFAGRSNSGKSSTLNALAGIKNLARTSKTPGRTQLINLFALDEQRRLVDLPGYGYASVPLEVKQRWEKTLAAYLEQRQCLKGLMLVMDIRHPLKPFDLNMIKWASSSQLPIHILLNKCDKLSRNAANTTLFKVQKDLTAYTAQCSVQLFSALQKIGLDDARAVLMAWFE